MNGPLYLQCHRSYDFRDLLKETKTRSLRLRLGDIELSSFADDLLGDLSLADLKFRVITSLGAENFTKYRGQK
jgi:hypothetical protein